MSTASQYVTPGAIVLPPTISIPVPLPPTLIK